MIITTLLENTTTSKKYEIKHGLCLHIKTSKYNMLFDLGPDDTFISNAEKLNIDIADVDIVIISHGHKDHGGGLEALLKHNSKAKIYINENAFNSYYTTIMKYGKHYIGLDSKLKDNDRIILVSDNYKIDDNISLFSNVEGKHLMPNANKSLFKKEGNNYVNDDFNHEQNLIIKENHKYTLISGCSHCGITNIIEKGEQILNENLDTVIGGFHLFNPVTRKSESDDLVNSIGENLSKRNINFYTYHCTGLKAFDTLHQNLGNKISYLSTGQIIEI